MMLHQVLRERVIGLLTSSRPAAQKMQTNDALLLKGSRWVIVDRGKHKMSKYQHMGRQWMTHAQRPD